MDKIELPTILEVTSLINNTHSWLSIEDTTIELKLLHLVESSEQKGSLFDF